MLSIRSVALRCVLTLGLGAVVSVATAADWLRFRGPDGSGVDVAAKLPVKWSATENLLWKTPLPGAGGSTPITVGDKIFVTCYSGYAQDQDNPGEMGSLKLCLLCVDRPSGKIVWDAAQASQQPAQPYRGFIALHGYASNSPVSDGQAVYVFWGHTGVDAYDLSGKVLWHASVGEKRHGWGSGASPILCGNLVIVNASVESSRLVAIDKATGKQVWQAEGIDASWGTPALAQLPGGKSELVVSIKGKVLGFDPQTGKRLWECEGIPDYVCPSVLVHGDVAYFTAGRKPMTVAVRLGGSGDVTKTHRLWEVKKTSKVPTPLYHDGLLYWVDNKGVAACLKADSGETVYEQRNEFRGGGDKVYASPVLAGDKLYVVSRQGGAIVYAAGSKFEVLAHNDLGDASVFNASPVIAGNRLLLRSDKFLYCIGNAGE